MNGFIEHVHTIVDPTNLRLDLKRALPPIQTDCTHDLSGHLHMIKVRLYMCHFITIKRADLKLSSHMLCHMHGKRQRLFVKDYIFEVTFD